MDYKKRVYNISLPNLKPFFLWPTFLSTMLLASPVVPQTQETRKVCVSTFLPDQYAQIILISSNLNHPVMLINYGTKHRLFRHKILLQLYVTNYYQ